MPDSSSLRLHSKTPLKSFFLPLRRPAGAHQCQPSLLLQARPPEGMPVKQTDRIIVFYVCCCLSIHPVVPAFIRNKAALVSNSSFWSSPTCSQGGGQAENKAGFPATPHLCCPTYIPVRTLISIPYLSQALNVLAPLHARETQRNSLHQSYVNKP